MKAVCRFITRRLLLVPYQISNNVGRTISAKSPSEQSSFENLTLIEQSKGIKTITFNLAKKRNVLSKNMLTTLLANLQDCDDSLRVIILKSIGKVFSSGHDLSELRHKNEIEQHRELFSLCTEVMSIVPQLPVPVIAQVSGLATAAGCQLVASCDVAVAAESAQFALPGILVGLFCSTPAVVVGRSLPNKVTMEMLFTGRPISSSDALKHGLISRVVKDEELETQTLDTAERICEMSKSVISMGKSCFYRQMSMGVEDAYRLAEETMVKNLQHPDAREGIAAFIEKRKAHWSRDV